MTEVEQAEAKRLDILNRILDMRDAGELESEFVRLNQLNTFFYGKDHCRCSRSLQELILKHRSRSARDILLDILVNHVETFDYTAMSMLEMVQQKLDNMIRHSDIWKGNFQEFVIATLACTAPEVTQKTEKKMSLIKKNMEKKAYYENVIRPSQIKKARDRTVIQQRRDAFKRKQLQIQRKQKEQEAKQAEEEAIIDKWQIEPQVPTQTQEGRLIWHIPQCNKTMTPIAKSYKVATIFLENQ